MVLAQVLLLLLITETGVVIVASEKEVDLVENKAFITIEMTSLITRETITIVNGMIEKNILSAKGLQVEDRLKTNTTVVVRVLGSKIKGILLLVLSILLVDSTSRLLALSIIETDKNLLLVVDSIRISRVAFLQETEPPSSLQTLFRMVLLLISPMVP